MSSLSKELVFLILQFLDEEKFKDSVHKLEQESGYYFNMRYFEEKVLAGDWDVIEEYLAGFTKVDDNRYSMKIFFEIRKQKYLEALDRNDKAKAVEILVKDLKVFFTFNEDLYNEITHLVTLDNFRENQQLSKYGDTKSARGIMLTELRKLIEANPSFREKLAFPGLKTSRLRTLVNQSLNWQHQLCKNPKPNPDIKTLFTDHSCQPPNGARGSTPVTAPLAGGIKPALVYFGPNGPFVPNAAAANAGALSGWLASGAASSVQAPVIATSAVPIPSNQVSLLKRPGTPNALGMIDYQPADPDQLMKRLRSGALPAEELTYSALPRSSRAPENVPQTVARTLNQGSTVTRMDFHPSQQTLLLVGSSNGEISLWEVGSGERLLTKPFKIWNPTTCSLPFQTAYGKDNSISVTKVTWSPDGSFIGVAYSKHLIQIYAYQTHHDLRHHLEFEAHMGGVNDLAFCEPNYKRLCVATCGDDKLIRVWDLNGRRVCNLDGHQAPVCCLCPHQKENIPFIFATALDGKIKAWLYDSELSRVNYEAPGRGYTTILYSADGNRLFTCGINKDGESHLVEWTDSEGTIKRIYTGFRKKPAGAVHFDTTQNRYLAVGDDYQIKVWHMDNPNILMTLDAGGRLPVLPSLRFNKEGSLLAVTTSDNGFKILANANGLETLRRIEERSLEAKRAADPTTIKASAAVASNTNPAVSRGEWQDQNQNSPSRAPGIPNDFDSTVRNTEPPRNSDDVSEKSKPWELTVIADRAQCRVASLPETDPASKVCRLLYTNSATGLLAVGSNGVQKLWKWSRNEQNPSGKATASVVPQHWQPNSGLLMTNHVSDANPEEAVPCIALSRNDSYVLSASGGKVSLFNMMTFKVMTTFMAPPPASTSLAFDPEDNNIIAVGMEDSTIHIYNVRVDEVRVKLRGHHKRITGLAFSANLNVLISSGADGQLCTWNCKTWEKKKSIAIQLPEGKSPNGETRVQLSSDQSRILVSHESQLALYDASNLELLHQWWPQDALTSPVSCATYSCNSQLIFVSFLDAKIGVFDGDRLKLRCLISPSAFLPPTATNSTYPLAIAAHPQDPNQFAIGLTNGTVEVVEPCEGNWGSPVPLENGITSGLVATSSTTSNQAAAPDQQASR